VITSIQRTSQELIILFESKRDEFKLSAEQLQVLKCFLDPNNMIKQDEFPNPLNVNEEMLEVTRDNVVIRKQPYGNVPMKDAIWEFFDPENLQEG